ncbi:MAG: DUF3892 domain-containing protein [Clostridiales bacterium]|jgi:hypothetical protein|nr:DUF3892 domain-containing protein [Clostridiales bacterium]
MEGKNHNNATSALPLMAMKEIPEAHSGATEISALVKDAGRVTGYQLSDGKVLSKQEAVAMARAGGIKGVGISERDGDEYLKSIPDGTENNNLSHLPTVSQ